MEAILQVHEVRHRDPDARSGTSDLAVLTPSFRGDASLFAVLHASVLANTASSVVHHVVVPPSDAQLFRKYAGPRCHVWTHRDFLPRHFLSVPRASGLTLNLHRPWPPARGWIVQQLVKIAGTAALDARAALVIDSDAVLLREPTFDELTRDGRPWNFRKEAGVSADMDRHLLWHKVARRLLGVSGAVSPPAPDYISPIAVWDPAVVRSLTEHIAASTGRNWIDVVAAELHFSEFIAYGVFVDHVLGDVPAFGGPLCHNYYERVPMGLAEACAFADAMPSNALGAMISSHSRTPHDVRLAAFQRCAEIADGSVGTEDEWVAAKERRRSMKRWCVEGSMLLAQISALAPGV
jgi:hypothetical protein